MSTTAPAGAVRAVHQFVPALIPRDATGSHTLLLRDALRAAGWRSEIYAEATHDELLAETIPVDRYADQAAPDDVLVYQFSTSSMVADLLVARQETLVIDFHNITAPELYEGWDPAAAERSVLARQELAELAPRAVLGLAVSHFNEADLRAAGCRRTVVVPVLVDHGRSAGRPDQRTAERLAGLKVGGGADWLFVGRLVPSKAQHQLVKALWAYRRLYDPRARLHLIGAASSRRYVAALRGFIDELGLAEAVRISGGVPDGVLAAHMASADAYVSVSVHEGFGAPLIEAMHARLPVVAFGSSAIPETVGQAGLVLETDEPSVVAGAVHAVLSDEQLKARLVAAGKRRAAELSLERCAAASVEAIATVAGPPPRQTMASGSPWGRGQGR